MDWAEELKISVRKTARKGRRAVTSRDVPEGNKSTQSTSSTGTSSKTPTSDSSNTKKDVNVEMTLDPQHTASNSTVPSTRSGISDNSTIKRLSRRSLSSWAENSSIKILRSKKNSIEDERYQLTSAAISITSAIPEDDIPIIPDLDDVKDEILMHENVVPPSHLNRTVALKELNLELFSQSVFSSIEDVDLSILMRALQPPDTLYELDEAWQWDQLFTDVIAEINASKATVNVNNNTATMVYDEIMPTSLNA